MKVLNSLVTELLHVQLRPGAGVVERKFTNPRDGWVFFSSTAETGGTGKVWLSVDQPRKEKAIITHRKGKRQTLEAMRELPAGRHTVYIGCEGGARPKEKTAERLCGENGRSETSRVVDTPPPGTAWKN